MIESLFLHPYEILTAETVFPAHTHQASTKTGTGNGGETLQPKWKYLYADLYRKKIHGIRP